MRLLHLLWIWYYNWLYLFQTKFATVDNMTASLQKRLDAISADHNAISADHNAMTGDQGPTASTSGSGSAVGLEQVKVIVHQMVWLLLL